MKLLICALTLTLVACGSDPKQSQEQSLETGIIIGQLNTYVTRCQQTEKSIDLTQVARPERTVTATSLDIDYVTLIGADTETAQTVSYAYDDSGKITYTNYYVSSDRYTDLNATDTQVNSTIKETDEFFASKDTEKTTNVMIWRKTATGRTKIETQVNGQKIARSMIQEITRLDANTKQYVNTYPEPAQYSNASKTVLERNARCVTKTFAGRLDLEAAKKVF